jgi:hypothetical protein
MILVGLVDNVLLVYWYLKKGRIEEGMKMDGVQPDLPTKNCVIA